MWSNLQGSRFSFEEFFNLAFLLGRFTFSDSPYEELWHNPAIHISVGFKNRTHPAHTQGLDDFVAMIDQSLAPRWCLVGGLAYTPPCWYTQREFPSEEARLSMVLKRPQKQKNQKLLFRFRSQLMEHLVKKSLDVTGLRAGRSTQEVLQNP